MPNHSSSRDCLRFSLTPIQLVVRPPKALRKSGEKYEASAELLVKWLVGTSSKGRACFSIQLPLHLIMNGSTESTQIVLSLTGMDNIVFEAKMRRKLKSSSSSSSKYESGAVLYQKKMLRLEITLLIRKKKKSSIQNTMNEVSFEKKEDPNTRVSSFPLAKCLIDLRDLIPGGDVPHCVRLQMENRQDYMDVDCIVQSSQNLSNPETRVNFIHAGSSTSSTSSTCSTVCSGVSESVATANSSDGGHMRREKEITKTHNSSVVSTEAGSLYHDSSDHPLMLSSSDVQISLTQEEILRKERVGSIHNKGQQQQQQQEELAEAESSGIVTMAPMPNADLSTIYEYCETSLRRVALLYEHGEGTTTTTTASKPPFSPLQQILREGVSCEQQFMENDAMKLFNKLFPHHSSPFAFMPALHSRRRDSDYPTTHTWLEVPTTFPHVAYYTTPYKMRYRKDQSLDAYEYAVVVAAGNRVLVHVMSVAPSAPLVGSELRVELLVEIIQGGLVRAVVFISIPRKLRLLMRSQITTQMMKFERLLRETLSELAHRTSHEVAKSKVPKETSSLLVLNLSSSVDPNMWRRLRSVEIFPHEAHVEVILSRLQQIDLPPPRECEPLVCTLEELVCLHRDSATIVRLVILMLMRIVKERINMEELVKASPTLATTLQQVCAVQPLKSLFTAESTIPHFSSHQMNNTDEHKINISREIDIEEFLKNLSMSTAFQQERKRRELSAVRNVWEILSTNVGDRVIAAEVLQRLRCERILLSSERQCHLLNAALVLHMDYAPIAISILIIMVHNYRYNHSPFFHELKPLTADFIFALKRAMKIYHEDFVFETSNSLLAVRDAFTEALDERYSNLTFFQKHFVPVLSEDSLFTCKVRCIHSSISLGDTTTTTGVTAALIGETMLTVTPSFLCIGSNAFPLVHIQQLRLHKHWWCLPALTLYIKASSDLAAISVRGLREEIQHEISIVVWQRKELVSLLLERNSEILVDH
ncbi:uncharacterized protein TM35_000231230 [Trypanosoma theileri]|uniref:Uncharacterized protein n=1 Tax=Trypanosoma theileri TaxID=67003 RepID=A0A1X0NR16_9TRYP|nr:uncharacterized protein TM35_000231230 [Trypanosoma theileri]ORC87152.1 hypothetical protein TM35_000231230 [Trypanosoma theileri]